MPKYITEDTPVGDVYHIWDVEEYTQHQRGKWWYIMVFLFSLLFIFYGLKTQNFLFALIVVLTAIIVFLQTKQIAPKYQFAITDSGIVVGNKIYSYNELDEFFIVYQPPEVKILFVETKDLYRPKIRIPIDSEVDPMDVRHALRAFLPENLEREDEPLSDKLVRRWKLH
ncbi:MAG: hypothetical protein COV59_04255 [Candidatus Magasanikbacteria bacterium CG11_big_fil_rev_8_21_14_0_20_39_34]|uniref:DUF5673 domain-containing protein n=1 Tax=Candidatus Magasanikbacteria bacterium CG11_big_fil_rev_8_21_14_0_20_39_34 TaxID=1974653 RepID=A0A2H0N4P2_9BACT|nr:MAG: hypothetical protein COV59_04255 [Candidatus Magasanikbacteria bacterium CG11_big_fil_rev_8_21_14_0_20_39_34]